MDKNVTILHGCKKNGKIQWHKDTRRWAKKCDKLTAKQEVWPGCTNWMWPETAFSLTPDSNQICPSSLHVCQGSKSTQIDIFLKFNFCNLCQLID